MSMFERVLLLAAIAVTSLPAVACDTSEASPFLPAPAKRDAGPIDAAAVDAAAIDAMPIDAAPIDAVIDAGTDAALVDAAPIDAIIDARRPIDGDILFDSQEAPPLYDARIISP